MTEPAQNTLKSSEDSPKETATDVIELSPHDNQPYPAPPPWQKVPTPRHSKKRKTCGSPPEQEGTSTENRFSNLPLDSTDEAPIEKNRKPSKPPPIVLNGIQDVNELRNLLLTVSTEDKFKLKILNKYTLHVLVGTPEEYKKIIILIRSNGLIGHTFTPKDSKCYRIVIKNLHHTTPHEAINEAVEATNNKVKGEIINARYGPDKTPTSTFFVNIEPSVNNPAAKKIEYIYNQKVKIEDPRKSKGIVQCQRCLQYGHSKNNCMRPYQCVKCAGPHKSSDCKKDRATPATCGLCSCDHPANYKGCQIYKDLLARRNKNSSPRVRPPAQTTPASTAMDNPIPNTSKDKNSTDNSQQRSYAEVTNGNNNQKYHNKLEEILVKQSEKMDLLIQQIGSLVGLITTLVTKLAK
jgi:hypothetical protein